MIEASSIGSVAFNVQYELDRKLRVSCMEPRPYFIVESRTTDCRLQAPSRPKLCLSTGVVTSPGGARGANHRPGLPRPYASWHHYTTTGNFAICHCLWPQLSRLTARSYESSFVIRPGSAPSSRHTTSSRLPIPRNASPPTPRARPHAYATRALGAGTPP